MPREVIMPALGMAQDTGLIVAWLKAEGDAVAEGDALFEVETDKATMEVEAQGAGFLTNVRAGEGESVPVGDVIALISETAEGAADNAPAPKANGKAEAEDAPRKDAIAGRQVIMPALGMAQDTGRIVDWLVGPGDKVAEGDPLFEVETDKATMEVSADTDGYVAAMYAEAGNDVPVGDVIAVISTEKPDNPVRGKAAPPAEKPAETAKVPAAPTAESPTSASKPTAQKASGGRILASPKAKRLASERGIDLARLVDAGIDQPFHAADLDRPEVTAAPSAAPATTATRLRIEATAPAEAFDTLAAHHDRTSLFAALAAGALRAATAADHIAVELQPSGTRLDDPDLPRPGTDDAPPALILRDLSATRLTSVQAGGSAIPAVTLVRAGDALTLTLDADAQTMGEATATEFVAGLADRLADPLRQLF